jgi:hypothetical protein
LPQEILFPGKDIKNEWKNLQPFGQQVIFYDYNVMDKLSTRIFEARIVGYTLTHGAYQVVNKNRKQRVSKDPKPIKFINTGPNDPGDYTSSEDENTNPNIELDRNNLPLEATLPAVLLCHLFQKTKVLKYHPLTHFR